MKLSVIIPSYKDPYLVNTIQSVLDNFESDYEIIPVIDGYECPELPKDTRIKPVILSRNVGMRGAINAGISYAEGEYLLRADEHVMFCRGYDRILLENAEDNQIITGIRKFLDPVEWKVMEEKGEIHYEKLEIIDKYPKFSSVEWKSRTKARKDIMIDENMAIQGSCWMMKKSWWDKVIVKLDSEGYGTHYQDTTEMLFKTWKAGGSLMLNKNAWYAHKHRSFNRTHQYDISLAKKCWEFAIDTWRKDYEIIRQKWGI